MGRQLNRRRPPAPWRAAAACALAAAAAMPARAGPTSVVEPCCDLCPQAGNRAAYTTKALQSVTTLLQGRDGWLFRTDDDLRTTFGPDADGYADLRRFRNALKARGVELVMVYQPTRGLMHADKLPPSVGKTYNLELARFSYAATLKHFRDLGITVPGFERLVRERAPEPYFYRGDHHWTADGSRRTAQITAEAIRAMPAFASIPKAKYVTEKTGIWGKRGTLQKAATELCGFGYADQYAPRFVTAPEASGDLFADERVPQVALVGTSNSDSAYNFAGFLSEYLGVDILNEAVTGGGLGGALLRYLPSDTFQKSPPKVLIWELEAYHSLSKELFYRQVVPLVGNGCKDRRTQLARQTPLKAGTTEVLFNGSGAVLPLKAGRHLLDVKFSDPNVKEFKGVVWYTDGRKETISIEHSEYVDTAGRFVVELRDGPDWRDRIFLSLDLQSPPGVASGTTVSAQMCARGDAAAPRPPANPPAAKKRKA